MLLQGRDTLAERRKSADLKMHYRMLSGYGTLDTNRFMLHIYKKHDTRHVAAKGTNALVLQVSLQAPYP